MSRTELLDCSRCLTIDDVNKLISQHNTWPSTSRKYREWFDRTSLLISESVAYEILDTMAWKKDTVDLHFRSMPCEVMNGY